MLLFAVLAIQVKRRCPTMHTYLEVVLIRWGPTPHKVFLGFALLCNCIVSAMLLLGGSAVIEQLTGLTRTWSCFLIPIGVLFYTYCGGLRATFFASYLHTCIIFCVLLVFVTTTYARATTPGVGSPTQVFEALWNSSVAMRLSKGVGYEFPDGLLQNQGVCMEAGGQDRQRSAIYTFDPSGSSCSFQPCPANPEVGSLCDVGSHPNATAYHPDRTVVDSSGRLWIEEGCDDGEVYSCSRSSTAVQLYCVQIYCA